MAAAQLLFKGYKNSFTVFVKNMQTLSVAQIQELQHFVAVRHGYFDFNTFTFSIQKKISYKEFVKLLVSLNIDADVEEGKIQKKGSSKKVSFGKYKGMLYSDLPDSYLLWLSKNYNGEDRNIIACELQNRNF